MAFARHVSRENRLQALEFRLAAIKVPDLRLVPDRVVGDPQHQVGLPDVALIPLQLLLILVVIFVWKMEDDIDPFEPSFLRKIGFHGAAHLPGAVAEGQPAGAAREGREQDAFQPAFIRLPQAVEGGLIDDLFERERARVVVDDRAVQNEPHAYFSLQTICPGDHRRPNRDRALGARLVLVFQAGLLGQQARNAAAHGHVVVVGAYQRVDFHPWSEDAPLEHLDFRPLPKRKHGRQRATFIRHDYLSLMEEGSLQARAHASNAASVEREHGPVQSPGCYWPRGANTLISRISDGHSSCGRCS